MHFCSSLTQAHGTESSNDLIYIHPRRAGVDRCCHGRITDALRATARGEWHHKINTENSQIKCLITITVNQQHLTSARLIAFTCEKHNLVKLDRQQIKDTDATSVCPWNRWRRKNGWRVTSESLIANRKSSCVIHWFIWVHQTSHYSLSCSSQLQNASEELYADFSI